MVPESRKAIIWAPGLWFVWTLTTWWFEGRIGTFRRPDAVTDRLVYTVTANVPLGISDPPSSCAT